MGRGLRAVCSMVVSVASSVVVAEGAGATVAAGGEPVAGGTLTYYIGSDVPGMDNTVGPPSLAVTTNTHFLLVYDQLVRVDVEGNVEGRLAESVTGSADSVDWTVTLRPGLQFSDGTAFDAEALVWNWERFADPETGGRCIGDAGQLASFEAVDEVTVEVVLKEANSQFPRLLMACLGTIGSPTAIEELGEAFNEAPVGAGPFVLDEWVRGDHSTFVRNPLYWDAPRPYLDEIVVRNVSDQQQRYDAFRAEPGGAAFMAAVVSNHAADLEAEGYEVMQGSPIGGVSIGMNMTRPPFDDVRVRQAFRYALDPVDINNKAARGYGIPALTVFPEDNPFYDDSGTFAFNDLAKGQELIDAYVAEHGPIEVDFAVAQVIKPHGDAVTQQLSRLEGVTINEQILDGAVTQEKLRTRDFDMIWASGSGIDPEPQLYNAFHTGAQSNFGYSNPEMDAALELGRSSSDLETRREAYVTMAQLWAEEVPSIPIYRSVTRQAVSKDVRGFEVYDLGYIDFPNLWIDEA